MTDDDCIEIHKAFVDDYVHQLDLVLENGFHSSAQRTSIARVRDCLQHRLEDE